VIALCFTGCSSKTSTTSTPATPQQQAQAVLNSNKLLADSANALAHTIVLLREQGKMTNPDANTAQTIAMMLAKFSDMVATEMSSTDDWPTQKMKIFGYVTQTGLAAVKGALSPNAWAVVQSAWLLASAISQQVGGPIL
jgi:hypothetical protein